MINEIMLEVKYWFILVVIIVFGMIVCDIANREAMWDQNYASWKFNLSPSEGTGWIDSIIKP